MSRRRTFRSLSDGVAVFKSGSQHFVGLDISTSSTGYAAISARGELLMADHRTRQADSVEQHASNIVRCIKPYLSPSTVVAVEDYMRSFATGRFRTQGLFGLAELNGMVRFACWQHLQKPALLCTPNEVRAAYEVSCVEFSLPCMTCHPITACE